MIRAARKLLATIEWQQLDAAPLSVAEMVQLAATRISTESSCSEEIQHEF
jgi:hypothetical protein